MINNTIFSNLNFNFEGYLELFIVIVVATGIAMLINERLPKDRI